MKLREHRRLIVIAWLAAFVFMTMNTTVITASENIEPEITNNENHQDYISYCEWLVRS